MQVTAKVFLSTHKFSFIDHRNPDYNVAGGPLQRFSEEHGASMKRVSAPQKCLMFKNSFWRIVTTISVFDKTYFWNFFLHTRKTSPGEYKWKYWITITSAFDLKARSAINEHPVNDVHTLWFSSPLYMLTSSFPLPIVLIVMVDPDWDRLIFHSSI